jgi:hypothetical protein
MRKTSKIAFLLVGILAIKHSPGQTLRLKQDSAAKLFLTVLFQQNYEKCWTLIDQTNVGDVTREQFITGMKAIYDSAVCHYDSFELKTTGSRLYNDGRRLNVYSFRLTSSAKKIIDQTLVDISFYDSASYIASVDYKWMIKSTSAKTSQGPETSVSGPFGANIGGSNYRINGINLVHLQNDQALLAIQVETAFPAGISDITIWARKEGVKFARYAIRNGYTDTARKLAQDIHMTLLPSIGVSFYQSDVGKGFNVLIKPEEYQ